jgi:hypothetical protein
MVVVGLSVLLWYRERSRKATTIGIIALCGYGVLTLLSVVLWSEFAVILIGCQMLGSLVCPLLLVVAIITDRRQ